MTMLSDAEIIEAYSAIRGLLSTYHNIQGEFNGILTRHIWNLRIQLGGNSVSLASRYLKVTILK